MKSLTESILSTSGAGIDAQIKRWLKENDVMYGDYTIKNHIIYPKDDASVTLFNRDYDELPDYIQFADGKYVLILGMTDKDSKIVDYIKSFRGLPEMVRCISIKFKEHVKMPELKIKATYSYVFHDNILFDTQNQINIIFGSKYIGRTGVVVFDEDDSLDKYDFGSIGSKFELKSKFKFENFNEIKCYISEHAFNSRISKLLNDEYANNPEFSVYKDVPVSNKKSKMIDNLCEMFGFDKSVKYIKCYYNNFFRHETIECSLYKKAGLWHNEAIFLDPDER